MGAASPSSGRRQYAQPAVNFAEVETFSLSARHWAECAFSDPVSLHSWLYCRGSRTNHNSNVDIIHHGRVNNHDNEVPRRCGQSARLRSGDNPKTTSDQIAAL